VSQAHITLANNVVGTMNKHIDRNTKIGQAIIDTARNWESFEDWLQAQEDADLERFIDELGEAAVDAMEELGKNQ